MTKKYMKVILIPIVCLFILLFSFLFTNKDNVFFAYATTSSIVIKEVDSLNKITFLNGVIYAIDETNNQIIKYNTESEETNNLGGNYDAEKPNTTFLDLNIFCVLNNGSIFTSQTDLTGIKEYVVSNASLYFIKEYYVVKNNGAYSSIEDIADMKSDFNNNLYALEYDNATTRILLKSSTSDDFIVYSSLDLEITENAKLLVSYNSQNIFIFDSNKLYKVEGNNISTLLEIDNSISIVDIAMDYKCCMYLLNGNNTLLRYELQDSIYAQTKTLDLGTSYASFTFDFETGISYYAQANTFVIMDEVDDFFYSLNSYIHSIDFKDLTMLNNDSKIAKITSSISTVYKQPIDIVVADTLVQGEEVIILDDNIIDSPNYALVLLSKDCNGQKILQDGYILKSTYLLKTTTYVSDFTQPVTTNDFVKVYKYPTTILYTLDYGGKNLYLKTLEKGTPLSIVDNASDYHDDNGLVFYQIAIDGGVGYVLRSSVCELDENETVSILSPNAEIKCGKNSIVKVYNDSYKSVEISQIENSALVHKFNEKQKNGCVKIQFLNKTTNEVVTGYVQEECVVELGISMYKVLGIGLILIAILVVLLIIYFSIKRKRKNLWGGE